MAALIEMSFIVGLVLAPIFTQRQSIPHLWRVLVAVSCVYYILALFVLPFLIA